MPKIIATRQNWIEQGYSLFSNKGISGIVVERIAKKLNCNKSSFYWHFKTKQDFVNCIIEYWTNLETEQVIEQINREQTPERKFKLLVTLSFKKDPALDFIFFLKRYAKQQPQLRKEIDRIDQQRISYVADLLVDIGIQEDHAPAKAAIFYKYLIGYHEMIRTKKQNKNYVNEVLEDISHFIDLKSIL